MPALMREAVLEAQSGDRLRSDVHSAPSRPGDAPPPSVPQPAPSDVGPSVVQVSLPDADPAGCKGLSPEQQRACLADPVHRAGPGHAPTMQLPSAVIRQSITAQTVLRQSKWDATVDCNGTTPFEKVFPEACPEAKAVHEQEQKLLEQVRFNAINQGLRSHSTGAYEGYLGGLAFNYFNPDTDVSKLSALSLQYGPQLLGASLGALVASPPKTLADLTDNHFPTASGGWVAVGGSAQMLDKRRITRSQQNVNGVRDPLAITLNGDPNNAAAPGERALLNPGNKTDRELVAALPAADQTAIAAMPDAQRAAELERLRKQNFLPSLATAQAYSQRTGLPLPQGAGADDVYKFFSDRHVHLAAITNPTATPEQLRAKLDELHNLGQLSATPPAGQGARLFTPGESADLTRLRDALTSSSRASYLSAAGKAFLLASWVPVVEDGLDRFGGNSEHHGLSASLNPLLVPLTAASFWGIGEKRRNWKIAGLLAAGELAAVGLDKVLPESAQYYVSPNKIPSFFEATTRR